MWLTLSLFTFSDKEKPSTCSQQRKDTNRLPHWTYPGSTWGHHCRGAELPPVLPHITVRNDSAAFPEKRPGMKKYTFILNKARSFTWRRIFPLQVSADFRWAPDELFVKWNIFPQLLLLTTSPLPSFYLEAITMSKDVQFWQEWLCTRSRAGAFQSHSEITATALNQREMDMAALSKQ